MTSLSINSLWERVNAWRTTHGRSAWYLPIYLFRRHREKAFGRLPVRGRQSARRTTPDVRLVRVDSEHHKTELIDLYWRNPSKHLIAPDSRPMLDDLVASGVTYYLVLNESGTTVGAMGYREPDHVSMHIVTDYPARRQGFGLAAQTALESAVRDRGVTEIRSYVFADNARMISRYEADGWVRVDEYTDFGREIILFEKTL